MRTHGETGSHLPDEVLQPGLARLQKGGTNKSGSSSKSSASSKCPISKAAVVVASSAACDSASNSSSGEVASTTAAAATGNPGAYEYYVHYRLTNRRLDCWLPFSDLLPVNASGHILPPTDFQRPETRFRSVSAYPADTAVDGPTELGGPEPVAVSDVTRTDEHMPKRVKLTHGEAGATDCVPKHASNALGTAAGAITTGVAAGIGTPTTRHDEAESAAAAAAWKQLEVDGNVEAEELKALLFDPSLIFSDVR